MTQSGRADNIRTLYPPRRTALTDLASRFSLEMHELHDEGLLRAVRRRRRSSGATAMPYTEAHLLGEPGRTACLAQRSGRMVPPSLAPVPLLV